MPARRRPGFVASGALLAALVCAAGAGITAQNPPVERVDFARDVQPLLRQNCVGCHGPTIHQSGFRLDRRADAMRGGTIAVIGPGNSEASRLYLRLVGSQYGPQMPPTGALKPDQIKIIKDWIDQGAEWPDELAGDSPPLGPAPPLMQIALTGGVAGMRRLLDAGADPNARNAAGATALMWSAGDAEKTRLLLERGANVNARSDDNRTPLMIAAGFHGGARVVQMMLDWGADLWAGQPTDGGRALLEAAYAGEAPTIQTLRDAGALSQGDGGFALSLAVHAQCAACVDLLASSMDRKAIAAAALNMVPPDDDARLLRPLLARGADASAKDDEGRTVLLRAAASDLLPADVIRTLIERGADVNAKLATGLTAVGLAKMRGNTPVVDVLTRAGAADVPVSAKAVPAPSPASSPRAAVERSLPLLQANDVTFLKKSGCVSCHNNSLTALAVALSRSHGIRVDEEIAQDQADAIARYLESWRERALQGIGIAGDADTTSYILFGLSAESYPANAATDAMAGLILQRQTPAGQWHILAHRPPIESSDIQVTAVAIRALQVYAPKPARAMYDAAIRRAAAWLSGAPAATNEDRAFQLLGLGWTRAPKARLQTAAKALVAEQRRDGGWGQLPSLPSDAYATGQALVALEESGAMTPRDPAFARGVQFLLRSQLADGSWFVPSRALGIQPFFESGFPHGHDQFISAAATNWATAALALAVQ